ncbi:CU044_2847 family protein [Kitasatospora sp. NPDC028055]|uniref:CU044_2847 family protein n=1 Tax=Kitasatospora sp. NPDC028055 TaxID=3155653 RepID=UPI003407DDEC
MDELVEFKTDSGAFIVVAVEEDNSSGARRVGRADDVVRQAKQTFDGALESIHTAAESALRVFRDGSLKPDTVEIEFGVKLSAEAGAVIAKTAVEGHLVVKLSWKPGADGGSSAG